MPNCRPHTVIVAWLATLMATPAQAEDVIFAVSGARDIPGEIACRIYMGPKDFPFGKGTAGEVRSERSAAGTACIVRDLAPGGYAVVAAMLPKSQDDVTRDLLGRPRHPWGVSNNIRHALRAPRYEEAVFALERGKTARLLIDLAK